jgi:hypothetical protein
MSEVEHLFEFYVSSKEKKSQYLAAVEAFLEVSPTGDSKAVRAALGWMHSNAVDYYDAFEDIVGYTVSVAAPAEWREKLADDCCEVLRTRLLYQERLEHLATTYGFDIQTLYPPKRAYRAMQRLVRDYYPDDAAKLREQFVAAKLPVAGFDDTSEGESRSMDRGRLSALRDQLAVTKHRILFLAANPLGTSELALGKEARAIQEALERSGYRDHFELETRWAARPLDLLRELQRLKPTIVHFSGHGGVSPLGTRATGQAPSRDVLATCDPSDNEPPGGLYFQGPDERPHMVTAEALQQTFGAVGSSVKLVVLNACYSDIQADALCAHVDCVIGMTGSIRDDAARTFAIGFYGGLGERESVVAAYKQGAAAIGLEALHDGDRPQLKVRAGIDADQIVLAAD